MALHVFSSWIVELTPLTICLFSSVSPGLKIGLTLHWLQNPHLLPNVFQPTIADSQKVDAIHNLHSGKRLQATYM
jgi:hypothetical protein